MKMFLNLTKSYKDAKWTFYLTNFVIQIVIHNRENKHIFHVLSFRAFYLNETVFKGTVVNRTWRDI